MTKSYFPLTEICAVFCFSGDPAIGDGVTRYFFSTIMHKLQNGFEINFGKYKFKFSLSHIFYLCFMTHSRFDHCRCVRSFFFCCFVKVPSRCMSVRFCLGCTGSRLKPDHPKNVNVAYFNLYISAG